MAKSIMDERAGAKLGSGEAKGLIDRPEAWRFEVRHATSDRTGNFFYFNRS
jgi:hypothetical protein